MTLKQAVDVLRGKGFDVEAGRLFGKSGPWFVRVIKGGTSYEAIDASIRGAAERILRVVS
jgi:hypothetical protein